MKRFFTTPSFPLLIAILLMKAGLIFAIIQYAGIGLGPDEAQYWTWSQALDWGYYSKPPAIAWQIRLGTTLFGNTELGVRFGSIVIAFASSIAIYCLAIRCGLKETTAWWGALVFAFSPLGMLASLFAITDGGLFLFWTLACCLVASSLYEKKSPNYCLLGCLILGGALFKWPMLLFWIPVLVLWIVLPSLRKASILAGIAISLLGLLPSIIWNWEHEWATFRHVFATVDGGQLNQNLPLAKGNFWEFIGAQAALLSPIFFILFGFSLWKSFRERNKLSPALLFCGALSAAIVILFSSQALFRKMQGNWADFAYASGIVLIGWYACEQLKSGKKWLTGGIALSLCLSLFFFLLPHIQSKQWLPVSYSLNPFRQNVGWKQLNTALFDAGYAPKKNFLFGDKYQVASLLSYYGEDQKRAYFFNLHGIRKNQFSYWPSMADEQVGNDGYFVALENGNKIEKNLDSDQTKALLSSYFQHVEFKGLYPLFYNGKDPVKVALIYKCTCFMGKMPADLAIY